MPSWASIFNLANSVNSKTQTSEESDLNVPKNWTEFAQMSKIRSGGKIVNFNPYEYQNRLVELMLERSIIVIKARQLGISEVICNFMLWRACLEPGYLGVVFSKTQIDTSLLARRMRRMINSLGLKTVTENLGDIELEGRGRILFKNSKPDSARGIESVVDVLFDEFAFIDEAKAIFDAIAPAQQMVGDLARCFIVSTPNGRAGYYWDLLNSGNEGRNIEALCDRASQGDEPFQYWIDNGGWAKVIIHWREHPIYGANPNFLEEIHTKKKLSWETIKQEYDLSFKESDSNYFDVDIIRKCEDGEPEQPLDNEIYFIGIDSNLGGEDYCVASVLRYSDDKGFNLVDWYRKKKQTSEYNLYQISLLIEKYKNCVLGIEVNSGGKIYFEELSKNHSFVKMHAIRTTADSKHAMLDRMKLVMEKHRLHYPKCPLVNEMLSFRRKENKLEAAEGCNDDFVLSVSFALTAAAEEEFN